MRAEPLDRWLQSLQQLLAPLAPKALVLLSSRESGVELGRVDDWPAGTEPVAQSAEVVAAEAQGWLIRLPPGEAIDHPSLLIVSDDARSIDDPQVVLARVLCRAAWRFRCPPSSVLAAGDESRQAVHDLRNGLNSVLMSTAVIGSAKLPEEMRGFVQDLESAGKRSLRALTELSTLMVPR